MAVAFSTTPLLKEVGHMKRVYRKPSVERIKLNVEEAVLSACKIEQVGASGANDLGFCGWHNGDPIAPCLEATS